jgi:hypothetical protein
MVRVAIVQFQFRFKNHVIFVADMAGFLEAILITTKERQWLN